MSPDIVERIERLFETLTDSLEGCRVDLHRFAPLPANGRAPAHSDSPGSRWLASVTDHDGEGVEAEGESSEAALVALLFVLKARAEKRIGALQKAASA